MIRWLRREAVRFGEQQAAKPGGTGLAADLAFRNISEGTDNFGLPLAYLGGRCRPYHVPSGRPNAPGSRMSEALPAGFRRKKFETEIFPKLIDE